MEIKKLNNEEFKDKTYDIELWSNKYLSVEPAEDGFKMQWMDSPTEIKMTVHSDNIISDWADNPMAYGAFNDGKFTGFIEGFLEKWNNRFRITNINIFDEADRKCGTGTLLMQKILEEAVKSGARMAVLETQSFNFKAISFYKKNGFEIIGFDRFAYSNEDPQKHNIRIEMGKKLI